MARKVHRFIWQFVIGFGFLSGLWTAIGINPETVMISALGTAAAKISSDPSLHTFFVILPTLILVISIIGAYLNGRIYGLIAVLVAYIAGLVILSSIVAGIVLLSAAILIAYLAGHRKK